MSSRPAFLLALLLACVGCAPIIASKPTEVAFTPTITPGPTDSASLIPEGWTAFASQEVGFAFAYPASAALASAEAPTLATITFPPDPRMNVVEESVTVSGARDGSGCTSPLTEGWPPEDLSPETIEVNGVPFLRQTRSGVAAGTSSIWVAYTTQCDQRCVSLGYVLRTFDPANLDATRFPTPPGKVDVQEHIRVFEAIVATFAWLG
jgi:hypothetical protein